MDQSKSKLLKRIFSDKRRIIQILLNLISNSLKFTNSGGFIAVHIQVMQEQDFIEAERI